MKILYNCLSLYEGMTVGELREMITEMPADVKLDLIHVEHASPTILRLPLDEAISQADGFAG